MAKAPGPKRIRCQVHMSTTHYAGCAKNHICRLWARRREVYREQAVHFNSGDFTRTSA